ncbi:Lipase 3 [Habropoda laboriosa]|uniref:Lipase n=1 Tax=Habropoda laboriosa TaxID=597456 RepID=A0A0L7RA43_9HYME|nr:PREDICTED: lipase 3-like [Habropoda laboriosa]KOC67730.1 Lipase 3 [Habropoda laboriosa]
MLKIPFIFCCILPVILGVPLTKDEYELNEVLDVAFDDFDSPLFRNPPTPDELIRQEGYTAETHEVVTEDGYILQVHRIAGSPKHPASKNKPVVLLQHGLLDCSASWIFTGPQKSLAFILADWGYDVWTGNSRGSRYSRKHKYLATSNPDYWSFSWHEIGVYDLPAMIDYALNHTKQKKLFYVGHSQGGTAFFVMASERPEYQQKIQASFNFAPAVFMSRAKNVLMRMLAPHVNNLMDLVDLIGIYEFKPSGKLIQSLGKKMCHDDAILQPFCKIIIFLFDGFDKEEFNMTLLPTIAQYDPAGASTMQLAHYAQLMNSGKFRKYDHGLIGNLNKYGKSQPPDYHLDNIKIPVYLYYSSNDVMVHTEDLHKLYKLLPNAQKFLVPFLLFSHLDFLFGKHVDTWVYNKVLNLMERHKN